MSDKGAPTPPKPGATPPATTSPSLTQIHGPSQVQVSFDPEFSKTVSQESIQLDADMVEIVLFHVDDMGLYQKLLFVFMCPFAVFFAWTYFVQIFLVATPRTYWCIVPELANLPKNERRDLSAPGAGSEKWDSCMVYLADWQQVISSKRPPASTTTKVPCSNGWEFDYDDIPYETVVSERGWVCDRASYVPTSQTLFFAGSFTGGLLFGWAADRFGRVPALVGVSVIGGIGGIGTIFTSSLWDFLICRFLVGMAYDNCFYIIYILVLEYVGPAHRTCMANLPIALYYGAGAVALPWIAYFLRDWRLLLWVTSLPMFIAIPAPLVIPESLRWLVSQGRVDDAVKVVKRFEKVNRTKVPDDIMQMFVSSSKKIMSVEKVSITALFKSRLLRTATIFTAVLYSLSALVYDGLVRMSESFGMDFFITFTINAAAEIPSVILITLVLDTLGRRNLTFGPLTVSCISSFIALIVPKGPVRMGFAVVSRFLINLAFTVEDQWAAEILPTPFRAQGSAMLHMSGFASSLVSAFVVYSERVWDSLPLLVLTILSGIAAGFAFTLPETKGQEMPQTVLDAEKIIQENSMCRKSEVKELKIALSKVMSSGFAEPVTRSSQGHIASKSMEFKSR